MSNPSPRPAVASFSIWQTLLLGLSMSMLFTFLIWLMNGLLSEAPDWSLSFWNMFLGMMFLPWSLYSHWAWHVKGKRGDRHQWLARFIGAFYISFLLLIGGFLYWKTVFFFPWNLLVNGILVILFVMAWALPAISFPLAKRFQEMQYVFDSKVLRFGGPAILIGMAGVLGANFGLQTFGNLRSSVAALLISVVSIGLAQHFAVDLWRSRVQVKKEE